MCPEMSNRYIIHTHMKQKKKNKHSVCSMKAQMTDGMKFIWKLFTCCFSFASCSQSIGMLITFYLLYSRNQTFFFVSFLLIDFFFCILLVNIFRSKRQKYIFISLHRLVCSFTLCCILFCLPPLFDPEFWDPIVVSLNLYYLHHIHRPKAPEFIIVIPPVYYF